MLLDAANVIENLSKKLRKANEELNSARCHNGWIPVDEVLPEDDVFVLVQFQVELPSCKRPPRKFEHTFDIASYCDGEGWIFHSLETEEEMDMMTVEAWMPLPDSYVPDTDVGKKERK